MAVSPSVVDMLLGILDFAKFLPILHEPRKATVAIETTAFSQRQ
jgi:hypothetical protein